MSDTSEAAGPDARIRDWMTIWQSEIAALGVDREVQEGWARLAGDWARAAVQMSGGLDPAGRAGTDAAPGAAAAADASGAGTGIADELAFLRGEVAGLRRRIEQLEARGRRAPRRAPPRP